MEQSIENENERNNAINENNENREDEVSMTITPPNQIGNYDDEEEEMPETNGEKNRDESFFPFDNEQDEDGLNSEDGNAIGKMETNQKNKKKG